MRIKIEGREEMLTNIEKAQHLLDELRSVVHKLGYVYGEFEAEKTAPVAAETENED